MVAFFVQQAEVQVGLLVERAVPRRTEELHGGRGDGKAAAVGRQRLEGGRGKKSSVLLAMIRIPRLGKKKRDKEQSKQFAHSSSLQCL